MKAWLKKWRNPLFIGALAFLLCFGVTLALLTDTESQTNVVVLGNVKVKLTEDPFEDDQTVVPGQVIDKPPVVHNTGKNDAYVFVEVTIPKYKVQMLYEENVLDEAGNVTNVAGTLKDNTPVLQELFRTLATTGVSITGVSDFQYNAPNDEEGWEFLGFGEDTNTKKAYWFGYNQKLLGKNGDTEDVTKKPVFDKIQLKSFIDGDIDDDTARTIGVNVFAIQADNLEMGLDDKTYLDKADLQSVLKIIQNKKSELGEIHYEK